MLIDDFHFSLVLYNTYRLFLCIYHYVGITMFTMLGKRDGYFKRYDGGGNIIDDWRALELC